MQALSIWPTKGDFLRVPRIEFPLGSSCDGCIRERSRRKRWALHQSVVHDRTSGLLFGSRNPRGFRDRVYHGSLEFDIGFGHFRAFPRVKIMLFGDPNCKFGISWSSEEQEIREDINGEDSEEIDGLENKGQGANVDCWGFDDAQACKLPLNASDNEEEGKMVNARSLAHSLHSAESVEGIDEVLKVMGRLPLPVYSSIIRGLGQEKRLEPAMALVDWLRKKSGEDEGFDGPNAFIYNSLLGAVKQSRKFEQVEKVVNNMAQDGISPNIVTYNTLMGIHLEEDRAAEALALFEDIQKKGISPSPASYSTVLWVYRRMEDGNGALNFFVDVREKYMKGELGKTDADDWDNEFIKLKNFTRRICYQVMRRWLVKDENLTTNVLKLVMDMDNAGLSPSHAEQERLIWACTREEHYIVAKELYKRIRERDGKISLSVCNHVIWLMGKAKKWWSALEIYEDLLDKGPKPNNMSYELIVSHFNILLGAARKRGIWRWGVRLLNKMESKGLKPGSKEWNSVLVACSKASETTAAVQIFKRMVDQGEKPTIISYGALLSALEKGRLFDEAVRVWEHMLKVGVEPNLYAYTIMASVYVGLKKLHIVDYIIQEMHSTGNKPTVVTFNAIISGCARYEMESTAYEWFHRMRVMGVEPNEITYEMLIEALAKDGKPMLAHDLYLRAQNEGLNLSTRAYDAVVESLQAFGASVDLGVLGPRPPEKKKKVKIRKNLADFCGLADVPRRSKPFEADELFAQHTRGNL